jgi:hypothetical protein
VGLAEALPEAAGAGSTAVFKGVAGGFGAVAEPAAAPPTGPSGGGCGGRPAATRWPATETSGRSGAGGWPAEAAGTPDGRGDRSAGDDAESAAAGGTPASGGSRPLLPGGVLPEFTADTPRRRAPWPLPPHPILLSAPRPHRHRAGPRSNSQTGIGRLTAHIRCEYGQRWEPRPLSGRRDDALARKPPGS